MSGFVPKRPVILGLAILVAATAAVEARDGDEVRSWRHTHHERFEGGGPEVEAGYDRREIDRSSRDRETSIFGGDIPDYRAVRGWSDDASAGEDPDDDAYAYGGSSNDPTAYPDLREGRAPPPVIIGSGRFSGNVEAWYRSGAGSTFTITSYDEQPKRFLRAGTRNGTGARHGATGRVITVDSGAAKRNDRACSFEAGVCVIRGR